MEFADELDLELGYLHRFLNNMTQKSSMSFARYNLLNAIKTQNPATLKQLAQTLGVAMPTVSRMVDELQVEGWVFRAQDKNDARKRWVAITQKGDNALTNYCLQRREFWQNALTDLSDTEKLALISSVKSLSQALSN